MAIRILVVDDHDVVRQGVRLILEGHPEWEICGEADNGNDALTRVQELQPDLVILDISMPGKDGLDVAKELQARRSRTKIIVLTMHDSKELSLALKEVGAKGYVVKSHAARDLVRAIQTVIDGKDFFEFDGPAARREKPPRKPLFRLTLLPAIG